MKIRVLSDLHFEFHMDGGEAFVNEREQLFECGFEFAEETIATGKRVNEEVEDGLDAHG